MDDDEVFLDEVEEDGVQQNESSSSGQRRRVKRNKTSVCWLLFQTLPPLPDEAGTETQRVKCKRCDTVYQYIPSYGTATLLRHHRNCPKNNASPQSVSSRLGKIQYDQFSELLVKAIIQHNLPFNFVEYEGIKEVFRYVCAFALPSRNTVKNHVLRMFEEEKIKLQSLLDSVQGRICLTSDLWSSANTDGYLCLTAHFIDKDWNLQKRILNFFYMPPPHNGTALAEKVSGLINEWGMEDKLFSITLDNASANDSFVEKWKAQLNFRGLLVMDGKLFHVRCCAHILNLIVQDGLKSIDESVIKIRECIKYIKASMARKLRFFDCVQQVGLAGSKKGLRQDMPTRWNSTHLMLNSALYYKRALINLTLVDKDFDCCPLPEEWSKVERISKFLGYFYDVTTLFSGTKYTTSNLFFPKVFIIQHEINLAIGDGDEFMRKMGLEMKLKFDKYWSDYSIVLGIAVVFDPRYKLQFVDWAFKKIYGANSRQFQNFKRKLNSLFDSYVEKWSTPGSSSYSIDQIFGTEGGDAMFEDFDNCYSSTANLTSELNQYLDYTRLDRKQELDILAWWRVEQYRYPILFRLACDVLAIPISTVASESAFSIGGRVLDSYRSSLLPDTVQALLCTRDWIFGQKEKERQMLENLTSDVFDLSLEERSNGTQPSASQNQSSFNNM